MVEAQGVERAEMSRTGGRFNRLSVVRKMALVAALVVIAGISGLVTFGIYNQHAVLVEQGEHSFLAITQLLAKNVTGGIRWNKPEAVERAYTEFANAENSVISNIITLTQDNQVVTIFESPRLEKFDLNAILSDEIAAGIGDEVIVRNISGHVVIIVPVGSGKANGRVGTLAVAWSLATLESEITSALLSQLILAALCLAAMIVALVFAGNHFVGRPLTLITKAMEKLAGGDTEVDVPAVEQTDDIGDMARMVLVFKKNAIEKARVEQQAEEARLQFEADREAQERILEMSVGKVVAAAIDGDLSKRIDTTDLSGVLKRSSDG